MKNNNNKKIARHVIDLEIQALKKLKSSITKKTKWLILNSPSNPTGACYSEKCGYALIDHSKDGRMRMATP